jgi:hypothetical protein
LATARSTSARAVPRTASRPRSFRTSGRDAAENAECRSRVGDGEEHVGVARLIERAIAGEITPAELSLHIVDRDGEAAGEQILAIPADRLGAPELQRVWIAPLRRPRGDDDVRRQSRSLPA